MSMMEGMISFMTDTNPDKGIGSIDATPEERSRLAKSSMEWNRSDQTFKVVFPDIDNLLKLTEN
jgi:hypothetical protein